MSGEESEREGPIESLPKGFHGFIWVRRLSDWNQWTLAFCRRGERGPIFQDAESAGDREGLSIEYFDDVLEWKYLDQPTVEPW